MISETILCDGCGKQLGGKKGTEQVKEEHIQFTGSVAFEFWDNVMDRQAYCFVSQSKVSRMHFCKGSCLDLAVDRARMFEESRRKEQGFNYDAP